MDQKPQIGEMLKTVSVQRVGVVVGGWIEQGLDNPGAGRIDARAQLRDQRVCDRWSASPPANPRRPDKSRAVALDRVQDRSDELAVAPGGQQAMTDDPAAGQ